MARLTDAQSNALIKNTTPVTRRVTFAGFMAPSDAMRQHGPEDNTPELKAQFADQLAAVVLL